MKARKRSITELPVFLELYLKIHLGKAESIETVILEMGKLGKMWTTAHFLVYVSH